MPFFPAVKSDALHEGLAVAAQVEGRRLAIFQHRGCYYALDDECPHRGAQLSKGSVTPEGDVICPLHLWQFRLFDGHCTSFPGPRTPAHAVELRPDGLLWVDLPKR
jgi:nitrite reductase/ring-hydroxylating ferredoxin subunit